LNLATLEDGGDFKPLGLNKHIWEGEVKDSKRENWRALCSSPFFEGKSGTKSREGEEDIAGGDCGWLGTNSPISWLGGVSHAQTPGKECPILIHVIAIHGR
jgi:hypothetical protein